MTLAFSTKINGKPTRFPEKIWQSLMQDVGLTDEVYYQWHGEGKILDYNMGNNYDDGLFDIYPKKHTIRADNANRWKEGNLIHPVINNRTPQRFQFAPTFKCTGVQKIEIGNPFPKNPNYTGNVWVDGRKLNSIEMHDLAINDGFDSVEHFFQWFSEDFTGKIIHWTDLRY